MTLRFKLLGALAATVAFSAAQAQTMKPGLWEMTSKVGGNPQMDQAMAEMQKQMAAMSPEQRKMMEGMMGKQGMGMGAAAGGGFAIKACITKEMAERNQMPTQQQGDCTNTISDKTSSSMKMKFTCTNPPSNGEGQVTFSGDGAYSTKMKINSAIDGKAQTMTVDGSGKWLGADCGSVKPVVMPKQ